MDRVQDRGDILGHAPQIKIFGLGCRFARPPFDSPTEDHMRYILLILLIYDDEKGWANLSEAERQHSMGEFEKLRQEIAGQYVTGSQVHPTSATPKAHV
jgi:hypothetical protein